MPRDDPNTPASPFQPLPDELDFPSMERRILDFWAEQQAFEKLRAKNADGPRWSFIDGPHHGQQSHGRASRLGPHL